MRRSQPREIHRLAIGLYMVWGAGSERADKFSFKTCQTRELEALVEKHHDVPCRGRRWQRAGDQGERTVSRKVESLMIYPWDNG